MLRADLCWRLAESQWMPRGQGCVVRVQAGLRGAAGPRLQVFPSCSLVQTGGEAVALNYGAIPKPFSGLDQKCVDPKCWAQSCSSRRKASRAVGKREMC